MLEWPYLEEFYTLWENSESVQEKNQFLIDKISYLREEYKEADGTKKEQVKVNVYLL